MNGSIHNTQGTAFDVLIIGAGISGINSAYRLQTELPGYSYAILEARDNIGGTWDLFKYPGIRSDSDLYTFGFSWHPWEQGNPIAEGPAIAKYMKETASLYHIDEHIRFKHQVSKASWSTEEKLWTLTTESQGKTIVYTARFIIFGTGYYDYHQPLSADIPGIEDFQGKVVHPQFWPEDLDYSNKKIVVIGSGATAVTLIPKLAEKANHVTMLQRSPGYLVSLPNRTIQRSWFGRLLPNNLFLQLNRLLWVIRSRVIFVICRAYPARARKLFEGRMAKQLPAHIPQDPHFKPRYNPWEQRLCVCPNGDFFKALRAGTASVATDTIKTVTKDGILLNSGNKLDADLIVTATGLKIQMAGGIKLEVDKKPVEISEKLMWNGSMLQDLPNAFLMFGYTNASWTLGCDAAAQLLCRLLKYMKRYNYSAVAPHVSETTKFERTPMLNLNSTYITRAKNALPQVTSQAPWVNHSNYLYDIFFANYGRITKGLKFINNTGVNGHEKVL